MPRWQGKCRWGEPSSAELAEFGVDQKRYWEEEEAKTLEYDPEFEKWLEKTEGQPDAEFEKWLEATFKKENANVS